MQLGMIGLARMGANMVRRLIRDGHDCVVFDRSQKTVSELVRDKAVVEHGLTKSVAAKNNRVTLSAFPYHLNAW